MIAKFSEGRELHIIDPGGVSGHRGSGEDGGLIDRSVDGQFFWGPALRSSDKFIRSALWASALFNLCGAMLFAFPDSTVSQLAGLPVPVPTFYAALLAEFILLFGGAYAWLAMQPVINRPLLAFGAIGKTGAFLLVAVLWLAGQAPARGVLAITGDLIFAGLFLGWLVWPRNEPER